MKDAIESKPVINAQIPASEWKWYGHAAHFICGTQCRFHMATLIGQHLVSTVGEYWPEAGVRGIIAHSRKVDLEGRGDMRDADYLNKIGYEPIGYNRKYETMVFCITGEECPCGCGVPKTDSTELDFAGYNDPKEARDGHMSICQKWSATTTELERKP